jgi:hypothetical protein
MRARRTAKLKYIKLGVCFPLATPLFGPHRPTDTPTNPAGGGLEPETFGILAHIPPRLPLTSRFVYACFVRLASLIIIRFLGSSRLSPPV